MSSESHSHHKHTSTEETTDDFKKIGLSDRHPGGDGLDSQVPASGGGFSKGQGTGYSGQGSQGSGLKHEHGGEDSAPQGGIYTSHGSSQPGSSSRGGPMSTPAISEDQPAYHPGHRQGSKDHNYGLDSGYVTRSEKVLGLDGRPAPATEDYSSGQGGYTTGGQSGGYTTGGQSGGYTTGGQSGGQSGGHYSGSNTGTGAASDLGPAGVGPGGSGLAGHSSGGSYGGSSGHQGGHGGGHGHHTGGTMSGGQQVEPEQYLDDQETGSGGAEMSGSHTKEPGKASVLLHKVTDKMHVHKNKAPYDTGVMTGPAAFSPMSKAVAGGVAPLQEAHYAGPPATHGVPDLQQTAGAMSHNKTKLKDLAQNTDGGSR